MVPRVSPVNAVITVGVYQLAEILIGLHQCLRIFSSIAEVHIIVRHSVYQQKRAVQLFRTGNRTIVIPSRILLRRTHKALGINGVVIAPRGRRSNGNTRTEYLTAFGHSHQRIESAEAPAPDGNALFIDIRLLAQPESCFYLILRLQLT